MSSLDIVWLRSSATALLMGFELEYNIKIHPPVPLSSLHILQQSNQNWLYNSCIFSYYSNLHFTLKMCMFLHVSPRFPMQPWSQLFPWLHRFNCGPKLITSCNCSGERSCKPSQGWFRSVKNHDLCEPCQFWKRFIHFVDQIQIENGYGNKLL